MAEDTLGTALIEIKASMDTLKGELDKARSEAESALKGIEGTASLGVDTSEVTEGADAADSELEGIEGEAGLGLDASEVESGANEADAMLDGIDGVAALGIDTGALDAELAGVQSQLESVEGTVVLGLDTSAIDSELSGVQGQIDSLSGSASGPGAEFGSSFSEGSTMAGAGIAGVSGGMKGVAGLAAGLGGMKLFGGFIGDARDAREQMMLLANQVEVTGASAWTSVDQISAMADQIQATTGISDEAVKASSSWLLSFKNVRNEMGEGNAVFDRAIGAATDLSAIMGGDLQGATTQLGKALNDPIKGITALSRAGVQFTEEQKSMIASMVEGGDILGAQRIILGEIEGQIGGTAVAMADGGDLMAASMSDLSESLGTSLLPAIDKFASVAQPMLDFFSKLPAPLQLVMLAIPTLVIGLAALGAIAPLVGTGLGLIGIGGTGAALGLSATLIPLGLIVVAIGAVIAIGYLLVTHWDTIKNAAAVAWDWIWGKIQWAADAIVGLFLNFTLPGLLIKHWDSIKNATGAAWDWVRDKVGGVVDWFQGIPGTIGAAFSSLGEMIAGPFRSAISGIKSLWNSTLGGFGFTIPSWVPGIGGNSISIPMLAEGGEILSSGFAVVGEAGPEVVWLDRGQTVSPISSEDGGGKRGGAPGGDGGQANYYFYGSVIAERDLARNIERSRGQRNYVAGRR
ncbi:MAG TPA: hypothetical protein VGR26_15055 [Acidimicrobiales bacterium]|nr:hypothetical protein [Acidimicrobiales bacterium]